jgi:hypothetical protein
MNEYFKRLPEEMILAMEALKELHATPDAMAIQCVLGTANLAAMKMYNVDSVIYGVRPINEFFINMAPTGAQKSTNYRETAKGIEDFEQFKQDELHDEPTRYALDKKLFVKEEAAYLKAMEVDPLTAKVPRSLKPIETAKYTISKATTNGIVDQLKSQAFVGLFSSEAGEFFNSHSFQGKDNSKAIEMSASLTSMWDAHAIEKLTGMEKTSLKNRRVSMLFLLQAETIQSMLNTPIFSDQGFIHRMLITQCDYYEKPDWEFTPESRSRAEAARNKMQRFHNRIYDMMQYPLNYKKNKNFELDLPVLRQTDEAHLILGTWRNTTKNISADSLRNYKGFAERLHEHALRLAATICAFRGGDIIKQEDALCARDLMEYYIEQRRSLEVGVSDYNPNRSAGANRMSEWLREQRWTGTLRELTQFGPSWFRKLNKTQRDEIITDLLSDEVIRIEETVNAKNRRVNLISLVTDA